MKSTSYMKAMVMDLRCDTNKLFIFLGLGLSLFLGKVGAIDRSSFVS